MPQNDVNQAIAGCKDKTYRDVLPFLEILCSGSSQAKNAIATESLATAMHRIASTGATDPAAISEVHKDRRFQALIQEVEVRLRNIPHEFNNQNLANVVWGAGKLRLTQRHDLFEAVELEVLNTSRRSLSSFTPQQLAAIAWGFVAADMSAPRLFQAIQIEARQQSTLEDLLQKAGLLQHLRQRGLAPQQHQIHVPPAVGGGWNQSMAYTGRPSLLGPGPPLQSGQNASVGPQRAVGYLPAQAPLGSQLNSLFGPSLHGLQLPHQSSSYNSPRSAGLYSAPVASAPGNSASGATASVPFASMAATPLATGPVASAPVTVSFSAGSLPHGSGNSPNSNSVGSSMHQASLSRYSDVSNRSDVAMAAEEHKKEMERKQREVLGDADSEWTCPLCIEPMDETDLSFLPCPCGYQICRLCYHRIANLEMKTCPACRAEYKEENIQKKSVPERKKDEGEAVETGWEVGAGKKKSKDKKPSMPSYTAFPAKVRELLLHCHEIGHVVRGELDDRVLEDLKALPERGAVAVLNEFIKKDMSRIRNKCAFLHRIIQRVQQEETQVDVKGQQSQDKCASAGGAPPASSHLPPQRARAVSDVGCTPAVRNGVQNHGTKAATSWAEKENGGAGGGNNGGGSNGPFASTGEIITAEFGSARRNVEDYHQSRPSLQLPGTHRSLNDPVGNFKDPAINRVGAVQLNAQSAKAAGPAFSGGTGNELLTPEAGAVAGSRLLAMLQCGGVGPFGGDRKQEKPPLFARAGGANARNPISSAAPGLGEAEALEVPGYGHMALEHCSQCGIRKYGDIDTSDGNFYCDDCWRAFLDSQRSESASYLTAIR